MKTVALIGANGFVGTEIANTIINAKKYLFIPVTRDDNLEDLIKKGSERLKEFSWEKAAKETLKVLHG